MGMSMTTTFTIFAKKAVREYQIPFEVGAENLNQETLEAIEEVHQMKQNPSLGRRFHSSDEMLTELLKDA